MFLKVATVVVRTFARPRHLPHCNVAVVFPREHFQSSTVVYFLRHDSTCRSVFSLRGLPELLPHHVVCHCPGCLATMFCHMSFCNWSRSTRKSFLPPFPNSRHCGHSALTTRHSNGNLATDFPSHQLASRGFSHTSSLPRSSFAVFSLSVTVVDALGNAVATLSSLSPRDSFHVNATPRTRRHGSLSHELGTEDKEHSFLTL